MKIKNITIQGFRGFNKVCKIDFHDRFTLIYAPNSYGKTSISEAFEWLLYGVTSKVEKADSKEEYKGSYRNCHLPESLNPFVKVTFVDDNKNETKFHGDLAEDEAIQRFVNEQEVESWPLAQDIFKAPRPFILQHALKYLLLVRPDERFQGFAHLLGLEKLDLFQRNVVSLCTKPDACIPDEVNQLLKNISALEARLASQPSLVTIEKAFKKGITGLVEAYEVVSSECRQRVSPETEEESILPQLLKIREDAITKIFKGRIVLPGYSEKEKHDNAEDDKFFLDCIANTFVKKYTGLLALATVQHILERAEFFDLGIKLLDKTPEKCPFCNQLIDYALAKHIHDEHASLATEKRHNEELQKQRTEIMKLLSELKSQLATYQTRHKDKTTQLLALEPILEKLKTILIPKHQIHFNAVETTISEITTAKNNLETSYSRVLKALDKVETSVTESKEDAALVKDLGETLAKYISDTHSYVRTVIGKVSAISDADQILKHELDTLAGTEDISVLIDFLEQRRNVEKKFEIDGILNGLKDLRKSVDQYVANRVLEAISGELTSEVMEWYGQIKTTGDPDVHFDGFDIERTRKGELKARRVQIKAKSYGKDLVSAVSSLSESKLNALGLCVSIATNLKSDSPFDFLIIDDPIQSWDAEHEIQFIEVIRRLVNERGKQVILMSHNRKWIDMVRSGCRIINGRFYEITGYTEVGPHIVEISWVKWTERLNEVDAIVKDQTATSVKLQQAEEEIRIVNAELTSELYFKIKGVRKNPHDLNSTKVRKMLVECGIKNGLVDKITQTFETTDDAHHAPVDYATHRQRIQCYHTWANELSKLL
jgi:DNA repair exonuclease SbcCD ATPase subunit